MSADRWSTCPKCKRQAEVEQRELKIKAGQAYGNVPIDEYLELADKANKSEPLSDTMREDFFIHTNEHGQFTVDYSCSCRECGFAFEYKHRQMLEI